MDTRTANREASQVGLGVIEEKICALARYHAELGTEPNTNLVLKIKPSILGPIPSWQN